MCESIHHLVRRYKSCQSSIKVIENIIAGSSTPSGNMLHELEKTYQEFYSTSRELEISIINLKNTTYEKLIPKQL